MRAWIVYGIVLTIVVTVLILLTRQPITKCTYDDFGVVGPPGCQEWR